MFFNENNDNEGIIYQCIEKLREIFQLYIDNKKIVILRCCSPIRLWEVDIGSKIPQKM